jgi:hypothetical protein
VAAGAATGQQVWHVVYDAPDVPSDWIARASTDLGAPLSVLGATVQQVGGVTIGGATLGIPDRLTSRVPDVLKRYGLATTSVHVAAELEGVA